MHNALIRHVSKGAWWCNFITTNAHILLSINFRHCIIIIQLNFPFPKKIVIIHNTIKLILTVLF